MISECKSCRLVRIADALDACGINAQRLMDVFEHQFGTQAKDYDVVRALLVFVDLLVEAKRDKECEIERGEA